METLVNHLKLKICGMREPGNIQAVSALKPDYLGFIFYERSPRNVSNTSSVSRALLDDLKEKGITPVAVCVDASVEAVRTLVSIYGFTAVQLHGHELPAVCRQLKDDGLIVFKAFSVETTDDVRQTAAYEGCCDCFLFDTKTNLPGGSGIRFDWSILQAYLGNTPFFLSGGLEVSSVDAIRLFSHPYLYGLDVNSRFEMLPGLKDESLLMLFINQLSEK